MNCLAFFRNLQNVLIFYCEIRWISLMILIKFCRDFARCAANVKIYFSFYLEFQTCLREVCEPLWSEI